MSFANAVYIFDIVAIIIGTIMIRGYDKHHPRKPEGKDEQDL